MKLGRLIECISELENNINQVEQYLSGDDGKENRDNMTKLIGRGSNFVAYKVGESYRFVPSRFIGYLNNSLIIHLVKGNGKNGTDTSPRIDSILKHKRVYNEYLEKQYLAYCKSINATPKKMEHTQRKYWKIDGPFLSDYDDTSEFSEGAEQERLHKYRERNRKLVEQLKRRNKDNLKCEICGFDFAKCYGKIGEGYIEAHHTIPLSEMKPGNKTSLEDMALVCANCHRMIHSKKPYFTIEAIKKSLL